MIAWEPGSFDAEKPHPAVAPASVSLLYRLSVAFPAWAGAILALYTLFICKSGVIRIRPR